MSRRRKRPPGSSQRSTGASRQRVSDRFPGSDALVESMLSGFAPHLEENGPLGSELLLSNLFGMIWSRSEYGRTEAVEAFTDEIIESQPFSHEAGGLLLLTIAKIGPSSLREKAQQLFDYGLSSGRGQWQLPGWKNQIGTAVLGRSATLTYVYGDQTSYYLEFSYPRIKPSVDTESHVLFVLVDYNMHLIKDMFLREGKEVFDYIETMGKREVNATFARLDPQLASDDIWFHLGITDRTLGEPFGEESAGVRYLLESRLQVLPTPLPGGKVVPKVTYAERDRIAATFMKTVAVKALLSGKESNEDEPPSRDTVHMITDMAIEYAISYGAGDPLRWSPIAVEPDCGGVVPHRLGAAQSQLVSRRRSVGGRSA